MFVYINMALEFLRIAKDLERQPTELGRIEELLQSSDNIVSRLADEDITNLKMEHLSCSIFNVKVSFLAKSVWKFMCLYSEMTICDNRKIQVKMGDNVFVFSNIPEDVFDNITPFIKYKKGKCEGKSKRSIDINAIKEEIKDIRGKIQTDEGIGVQLLE